MYSFVLACVKTSVISKTKLIDLIWTWIDYSIIVSIILLPDCPAACTCFVSFSLFSRVTISVVQKRKNVVGPTTPLPGGRGWGGTPLYKRYRYVPPHRVGFLRRFGLKMSIHFANFALESGMVFEGTTGVHERIYRFNSKWVRKNEKYANSKCIWRIFCLRSNLSNDNVISA